MKRKKSAYTLVYNVLEKVLELFKKDPEIQKVSEKHLRSGKFEKIRPLLLYQLLKLLE